MKDCSIPASQYFLRRYIIVGHFLIPRIPRWIKMPLGMEVGIGPGHIVLDGDPAPPWKGAQHPTFRPMSMWPNSRPSQLLLSSCRLWSLLGIMYHYTVLELCIFRWLMRVCCGSRWGFSLPVWTVWRPLALCIIWPCIQYITVYDRCGQYSRCVVYTDRIHIHDIFTQLLFNVLQREVAMNMGICTCSPWATDTGTPKENRWISTFHSTGSTLCLSLIANVVLIYRVSIRRKVKLELV